MTKPPLLQESCNFYDQGGIEEEEETSMTASNLLLRELQQIWNEIGETEGDKKRMVWELERECLQVYRRKVEEMVSVKACLHQSVAAKEAQLATLMAALGERNMHSTIQAEKSSGSLKEKLKAITPMVEDFRRKTETRMLQFADIKSQIEKISGEISQHTNTTYTYSPLNITDEDLSLRKLKEYQTHLRSLQNQQSARLRKVLEYVNLVHSLCGILGLDFAKTVSEVHPSLGSSDGEQTTNTSDTTLDGLEKTTLRLKAERKLRLQKVKDIVASLFELWRLMGSPVEEQYKFSRIISVLRTSEAEIQDLGVLSTEMIEQASAEVERLTNLKASRMKELVINRRIELEEICRLAHMDSSTVVDSGLVDPSELLANIETQIVKVKDEAMSRKEIMDRIDKWLAACEEENWLEEYNRDDTRYSAGRGAHINLKRAEKARVTVTKIPGMVDNLINKTRTWEDKKDMFFLYDGARLVSILEDYKSSRKRKEEQKRRSRDQKKLQDLILTEKESIYGSTPKRINSFRNPNAYLKNKNGSMTPMPHRSYSGRQNGYHKEMRRLSTGPLNCTAMSSYNTSICDSELTRTP